MPLACASREGKQVSPLDTTDRATARRPPVPPSLRVSMRGRPDVRQVPAWRGLNAAVGTVANFGARSSPRARHKLLLEQWASATRTGTLTTSRLMVGGGAIAGHSPTNTNRREVCGQAPTVRERSSRSPHLCCLPLRAPTACRTLLIHTSIHTPMHGTRAAPSLQLRRLGNRREDVGEGDNPAHPPPVGHHKRVVLARRDERVDDRRQRRRRRHGQRVARDAHPRR